jgi:hypothetical protein
MGRSRTADDLSDKMIDHLCVFICLRARLNLDALRPANAVLISRIHAKTGNKFLCIISIVYAEVDAGRRQSDPVFFSVLPAACAKEMFLAVWPPVATPSRLEAVN